MSRLLKPVLLFLLLMPAYAQQTGMNSHSLIDWQEGEVIINVETVYAPGSESLRIRNNSEEYFRKNFFNIFMESIKRDMFGPVYFNSSMTVEEKIQKTPDILYHIEDINNSIIKVFSVYSQDMDGMRMQYKLDLYKNIGSYFITHNVPVRPRKTVYWTPSGEYTGVVIYAKGEFPVHGEGGKGKLLPALFPSVYDEKMRKVISMEMVKPEFLEKWGTAAYSDDPQSPVIAERAGERPLHTMARKVYGRYDTDIIIPSADADRIFYRDLNRKLVSEGRFVIICTLPSDKP